jgi:hypothetical protein
MIRIKPSAGKRGVSMIAAILLLCSLGQPSSETMGISASLQFQIFLKILRFEKNLPTRAGAEIVIAVLYQEGYRDSFVAMRDILKALSESPDSPVENIPVKSVAINIDKETDIGEALTRHRALIIYVTPLRAFDIDTILSVSRLRKLITVTGVTDYVKKGVSIGLGLKEGKPEILINLQAAKNEGSDFSSNLLKLARIIGEKKGEVV